MSKADNKALAVAIIDEIVAGTTASIKASRLVREVYEAREFQILELANKEAMRRDANITSCYLKARGFTRVSEGKSAGDDNGRKALAAWCRENQRVQPVIRSNFVRVVRDVTGKTLNPKGVLVEIKTRQSRTPNAATAKGKGKGSQPKPSAFIQTAQAFAADPNAVTYDALLSMMDNMLDSKK